MPVLGEVASNPASFEYTSRMVESSWRHILAIAQNHIHEFHQGENNPRDEERRASQEFYDRERRMVHALDTLFQLAYEGSGYLAFIATITSALEPENPVAMAFLSHIVDRAALPSRETMAAVSPVILSKLNKPSRHLYSVLSSLISPSAAPLSRRRAPITVQHWKRRCPQCRDLPMPKKKRRTAPSTLLKLNSAALWSLLAEKFAGDLCQELWNEQVGDLLLHFLADSDEDLRVRIFALIALEKFALTGMQNHRKRPRLYSLFCRMHRRFLLSVIRECEAANHRIFLLHLNSFDTGFIPPEGKLRDDWTRYVQLAHCSRWALDNLACSWDLTHLKAIMNIFDATAHWKLGGNGLELRNDRPHFESIRATACVKKGKWYYETLLLTNGIMQLGWATNRCRFTPEEGYGVGDDCNGFAFDTYRTAVWADGSAVYPQSHSNIQCRAGDVLGSFLDLDNGLCTFFINGCDLGLTVEFEHPARQQRASTISQDEDTTASPILPPTPFNSNAETRPSSSTSSKRSKKKPSKSVSLGLYPAVSLTTHQHVLLNFGDRPWMYPPPVSVKYKGISEAGKLDEHYKNRVIKYVQKRKPRCKSQSTTGSAMQIPEADTISNSSGSSYDWDGPLCTICFSEPKNVVLLPCRHTGWGERCADALDMW
ncbi:hypothetical protein BJV82DRAFT_528754 [Fennellomyces sp. T-0311]|nr:hypothetical protein BJV82DRAFT_528754 [Fennellomyces sp. T-0311]